MLAVRSPLCGKRSPIALGLISVSLLGACLAAYAEAPLPVVQTTSELPDFKAHQITPEGVTRIQKSDLLGHVWVADFIFTTCSDICPRMSRQMRRLQTRLPPDVKLVSFTIDPEKDTPDALRGYAHDMQADTQRWYFLRMKKKPLEKLMREGFQFVLTDKASFESNANPQLNHNSRFVMVDKRGRVRAYYDGLQGDDTLDQVIGAADVLRKE